MRFVLRNPVSPYAPVDVAKDYLANAGAASGTFSGTVFSGNYYLMLLHRNSIATWSSAFVKFDYFTMQMEYFFRNDITSAYGSNMVQVDNAPIRYAIYGADVDLDESVDLTDIVSVFNDGNIFASGYVNTDVTGDDFVDLSDLTLTFNNANAFVSVIKP